MAVYTKLLEPEIGEIAARYEIGTLEGFSGITAGIENTNYLINAGGNKYILTIFEKRVNNEELPFFISLTDHLRRNNISCPSTLRDKSGSQLQDIKGKKAILISFLEGQGVEKIEDFHFAPLGSKVANMHIAVGDFREYRKNDMSLSKWVKIFEHIGEQADDIEKGLAKLIVDEIYFLADNWPFDLPSGVIHSDIFPDNVFFRDKEITGIIDFYFACNDFFAYDIAIIFNAWGIETDKKRQQLFLNAYEKIRPLSEDERKAMPILLRGAALRFLLTRSYDWFHTPETAQVRKKDPKEYIRKLKSLR